MHFVRSSSCLMSSRLNADVVIVSNGKDVNCRPKNVAIVQGCHRCIASVNTKPPVSMSLVWVLPLILSAIQLSAGTLLPFYHPPHTNDTELTFNIKSIPLKIGNMHFGLRVLVYRGRGNNDYIQQYLTLDVQPNISTQRTIVRFKVSYLMHIIQQKTDYNVSHATIRITLRPNHSPSDSKLLLISDFIVISNGTIQHIHKDISNMESTHALSDDSTSTSIDKTSTSSVESTLHHTQSSLYTVPGVELSFNGLSDTSSRNSINSSLIAHTGQTVLDENEYRTDAVAENEVIPSALIEPLSKWSFYWIALITVTIVVPILLSIYLQPDT